MIRKLFFSMAKERNYQVLPEVSLLRENQDTYYIGSAVMAHMHLFEKNILLRHLMLLPKEYFRAKGYRTLASIP